MHACLFFSDQDRVLGNLEIMYKGSLNRSTAVVCRKNVLIHFCTKVCLPPGMQHLGCVFHMSLIISQGFGEKQRKYYLDKCILCFQIANTIKPKDTLLFNSNFLKDILSKRESIGLRGSLNSFKKSIVIFIVTF